MLKKIAVIGVFAFMASAQADDSFVPISETILSAGVNATGAHGKEGAQESNEMAIGVDARVREVKIGEASNPAKVTIRKVTVGASGGVTKDAHSGAQTGTFGIILNARDTIATLRDIDDTCSGAIFRDTGLDLHYLTTSKSQILPAQSNQNLSENIGPGLVCRSKDGKHSFIMYYYFGAATGEGNSETAGIGVQAGIRSLATISNRLWIEGEGLMGRRLFLTEDNKRFLTKHAQFEVGYRLTDSVSLNSNFRINDTNYIKSIDGVFVDDPDSSDRLDTAVTVGAAAAW